MKEDLEDLYLSWPEPARGAILALRSVILEYDPAISETQKYGMPCFLYRGKILCYLWTDKKTGDPYILMAEGRRLKHPALEQGSRVRMKILRVDPLADLPMQVIKEVLAEALALFSVD